MKPNVCTHCGAIDKHFSFQCSLVRKPIKKGDIFKEKEVSYDTNGAPYQAEFRVTNISPSKPTYEKVKVKSGKAKKKSIAPISESQKKRLAEYRIVRDKYMKEHETCQAKVPNVCTGYSLDLHHMGGKIGNMLTNVQYFLAVCRCCHNWIGDNHSSAMNLGLVVERLNK